MSDISPLSPKQRRFVNEYLTDFNGTQAAIRSGYSEKSAKEHAYRLLKKHHIRREVDRRAKATAKKLEITRQQVLEGLLEAANLAKSQNNAVGIVAAWREVAKLLNMYPRGGRVESSPEITSSTLLEKIRSMSDERLSKLMSATR